MGKEMQGRKGKSWDGRKKGKTLNKKGSEGEEKGKGEEGRRGQIKIGEKQKGRKIGNREKRDRERGWWEYLVKI